MWQPPLEKRRSRARIIRGARRPRSTRMARRGARSVAIKPTAIIIAAATTSRRELATGKSGIRLAATRFPQNAQETLRCRNPRRPSTPCREEPCASRQFSVAPSAPNPAESIAINRFGTMDESIGLFIVVIRTMGTVFDRVASVWRIASATAEWQDKQEKHFKRYVDVASEST